MFAYNTPDPHATSGALTSSVNYDLISDIPLAALTYLRDLLDATRGSSPNMRRRLELDIRFQGLDSGKRSGLDPRSLSGGR